MNLSTRERKVPITILTGFLGAGKTTLLNHLLHADHGRRLAVLVNDFGTVNIDTQLVVGVEGEKISLANGCICCTIREDLATAVLDILQPDNPDDLPDHIVIEASGVSDPGAVALTFVLSTELRQKCEVDTILAVVDAEQLLYLRGQMSMLARRQIGVADFVVLNKVDLVDAGQLERTRAYIRELVPTIRILETTHGRVPLELALDTNRYQPLTNHDDTLDIHVHPEEDSHHHHDHEHDHHHKHEHEHDHDHEHNDHTLVFSTWRYTNDAPFANLPFRQAMKTLPTTIFRVKGFVHLHHLPDEKMLLQLAGTRINLNRQGAWNGDQPRTDLVFIAEAGTLNPTQLEEHLSACLATNVPTPTSLLDDMSSWLRSMLT